MCVKQLCPLVTLLWVFMWALPHSSHSTWSRTTKLCLPTHRPSRNPRVASSSATRPLKGKAMPNLLWVMGFVHDTKGDLRKSPRGIRKDSEDHERGTIIALSCTQLLTGLTLSGKFKASRWPGFPGSTMEPQRTYIILNVGHDYLSAITSTIPPDSEASLTLLITGAAFLTVSWICASITQPSHKH